MMDSYPQQQHRQKDILSFFPGDATILQQHSESDVHHCQGQSQGHSAMFQFPPSSSPSLQHVLGVGISMPGQQQQQQQLSSQSQPQSSSQHQTAMGMMGDLIPMSLQGVGSNASQSSLSDSTAGMGTGGTGMAYSSHMLLDQVRLTQLQQLQQLQQQIFQQQMALISGQASSLLNSSPATESQRDQPYGLPTPAPSGELRPQQQSLDYISPMILNNFVEAASGSSQNHHPHQSVPSSPSLSSNTYSSTPYLHPGSISAPEYVAFQTNSPHHGLSSPADLDLDISPLTSPWLGAQQNHHLSFQNQTQTQNHARQQLHNMSGSQYPTTSLSGSVNGSKRSASPSSTDIDARKKQSPAVRPTNPSAFTQHLDQSHQTKKSQRTGSRSTSSTPLLRARSGSTRRRKGSIAGIFNTPTAINEVPGDSPSPVDLSMPPPAPPAPPNLILTSSGTSSAPPSSAVNSLQQGHGTSHLTPVTPASIMNLDAKGKRLKVMTDPSSNTLGGSSSSQTSHRSKRGSGTSLISPSLKPILPGPTGNSTPLPLSPSTTGGHPGSMPIPPPSSMLPPQVRKTSHKAAEQKRRDSLKTTFDELRGLLPPIPLPSTSGGSHYGNSGEAEDGGNAVGGNGATGSGGGTIFGSTVKPLLPGALPPRGPPKAGGEGPNKGVSKLQLLICGNEYIRTLNGRVDRRDNEIDRLRKEVRKLRQMLGVANDDGIKGGCGELSTMGVEGLMEQLDLDLDLEGDIDAVEKTAMTVAGGRTDDNMSSARSDIAMDDDGADEDED
ncbi:hypothetical protein AX15_003261 [Amanita polypyramis BW_CC]|nr:hypothetical protein AX15_003261 [Amanita polypyramis BW_CC]